LITTNQRQRLLNLEEEKEEEAKSDEQPSTQSQNEASDKDGIGASEETYEAMTDEVFDNGKQVKKESCADENSSIETQPLSEENTPAVKQGKNDI